MHEICPPPSPQRILLCPHSATNMCESTVNMHTPFNSNTYIWIQIFSSRAWETFYLPHLHLILPLQFRIFLLLPWNVWRKHYKRRCEGGPSNIPFSSVRKPFFIAADVFACVHCHPILVSWSSMCIRIVCHIAATTFCKCKTDFNGYRNIGAHTHTHSMQHIERTTAFNIPNCYRLLWVLFCAKRICKRNSDVIHLKNS